MKSIFIPILKNYINQPKMEKNGNQKKEDNFLNYLPHIGVILVILGILIALTLYF